MVQFVWGWPGFAASVVRCVHQQQALCVRQGEGKRGGGRERERGCELSEEGRKEEGRKGDKQKGKKREND